MANSKEAKARIKINDKQSQIVIYQTKDGQTKINVQFEGETAWLSQKLMAELFGVGIPAINKHLTNIFEDGELNEKAVISILEITAEDGKKYKTKY